MLLQFRDGFDRVQRAAHLGRPSPLPSSFVLQSGQDLAQRASPDFSSFLFVHRDPPARGDLETLDVSEMSRESEFPIAVEKAKPSRFTPPDGRHGQTTRQDLVLGQQVSSDSRNMLC